jgi:excisionase family DNA binding protein
MKRKRKGISMYETFKVEPGEKLLSRSEVADMLRVSEDTVARLTGLPALKFGSKVVRYPARAVEAYMQASVRCV